MYRLSFRPSARIAGPDLFMHLRRVARRRTADFYFFYVDAGLVVFLNAIQTRLVVSESGLCAQYVFLDPMAARMRPLNTLCLKEMRGGLTAVGPIEARRPSMLGTRWRQGSRQMKGPCHDVHDYNNATDDDSPGPRIDRLTQIYKLGEDVPVVFDGIVVGYVSVADLLP